MSIKLSFTGRKRIRKSFGKINHDVEMPNLIEIQKTSYESFLQANIPHDKRTDTGLQAVFKSVFPINDPRGKATLEFVKYAFDEPYVRGGTFAAPLRVTISLIVWDVDEDSGAREVKGIKEQEVYFGDIPFMTKKGAFKINGTERVIVSQMHRSPGVFFDHDKGKGHSSGKLLYSARIIPYRGSWLDFEFDVKDNIYFRIDRKRKLPISALFKALNMTNSDIISTFYLGKTLVKKGQGWIVEFDKDALKGKKLSFDLLNADTGEKLLEAESKITSRVLKKLGEANLKKYLIPQEEVLGNYLYEDVIDSETGEVLLQCGEEITDTVYATLENLQIKKINIVNINSSDVSNYVIDSLVQNFTQSKEDALIEISRILRPGETPTAESAELLFDSLYFNKEKYDISEVGRVKLNARLDLTTELTQTVLEKQDIIQIVKKLCAIKNGNGEIDDIDHLGNRRVRSVGELIENQFRVGLVRVERAILERVASVDIDTVMPHDLINAKLLLSVIKDFFATSQLSQFMDQTNPLSEITHKRRLSALGPGGLTRERASFEVRDVHQTHYGRICPIETPEGQNIGLINSLSTFARVNKYGFIESPYRRVVDGVVTDEVNYLSAIEEGKYIIAQSDSELDKNGKFISDLISCRKNGDFIMAKVSEIDFVDVLPMQLVSVAASLIPFLENDDANRALMGSNMQRQAVPLLKAEAPVVGTGTEEVVARDSGATVVAKHEGIVEQVDGNRIVVRNVTNEADGFGVEIYPLQKFSRSNHNTCINQKPIVSVGDKVKPGDILADGPSTDLGELALGRNLLVAFMPWNGYNYEDSILISEKLVKEDVLTSIHIEEFEVIARDTRLGPEEITRDIPNVSDESLRHLDEVGIVHVGAEVKPGDILIGKVTPKSESPMTPEEKLLRAIFGEKAADVRDSSLHVSPGVAGTVVDVRVQTRRGVEKDQRALSIEREQIAKLEKDQQDQIKILQKVLFNQVKDMLIGKVISSAPSKALIGQNVTEQILADYPQVKWFDFVVEDKDAMSEVLNIKTRLEDSKNKLSKELQTNVERLRAGDDLPQGALKVIKVFIAMKHKLQPGDKMAGRHGNKGVISRILAVEDMPYLEDGTVADIVLNPLGVPSRMNIGQILETHLGWAAVGLGKQIAEALENYKANQLSMAELKKVLHDKYDNSDISAELEKYSDKEIEELCKNLSSGMTFATPVFDGAKEKDINKMLVNAGQPTSGQKRLIDGRTGERFDREITVGYIYMLKLHHLVDDKIHARSIGPYSLVTQQPLGGKSHFGGQRLGEMECWALQSYGASYTLQEMLTVKSDDVSGRIKMYEAIVRGEQNFESGIPESFNVMMKELRSLCLNVELQESESE